VWVLQKNYLRTCLAAMRKWIPSSQTCVGYTPYTDTTSVNLVFKLSAGSEYRFLVFGFTHGVWLRLADDDDGRFGTLCLFHLQGSSLSLQLTLEDGTDKEFRNVRRRHRPT
jgi:hypothetical protein